MATIRTVAALRPRLHARPLPSRDSTDVLLALMVLSEIAFLVGLIASEGRSSPLVNVWMSLATQWIPVAIFWLVAGRTGFRNVAVVLAATGVTLSALGDSYYSLAMDSAGYLAFPSPADAGYLLFYPLMVAAIIVLARRRLGGTGAIVLLECAVATLGASAVLAVLLDPMISGALGDDPIASAVAVAYPLLDLVLLAAIAGVSSAGSSSVGRRQWAFIVGLVIFAAADVAYALLEHQGAYLSGTPLDATWAIGLGFITWWVADAARSKGSESGRTRRGFVVPLPAVAVLAGLVVLIVATQVSVSVLAVVLAGMTVGLAAIPIVFRQAMLGRLLRAQEDAVRRLTELDSSKTDLIITMNHEFRTPLTSINGHLELLLDGDGGDLPPAAVGMLRTMENNGAQLQDLVDDMLTISRLEAGATAWELKPIYVSGLLARASAEVAQAATARRVELTTDCLNYALVVDADASQLEHAIVNVIDNAVKFTPGGGTVLVHAEGPTESGMIVVQVTDTGIGIPLHDIPRLTSRFFRASNVQGAAIRGVGLGLSITQRVVDAHGGSMSIDSTLGQGSTVTIRLPQSATGVPKPRTLEVARAQ